MEWGSLTSAKLWQKSLALFLARRKHCFFFHIFEVNQRLATTFTSPRKTLKPVWDQLYQSHFLMNGFVRVECYSQNDNPYLLDFFLSLRRPDVVQVLNLLLFHFINIRKTFSRKRFAVKPQSRKKNFGLKKRLLEKQLCNGHYYELVSGSKLTDRFAHNKCSRIKH